MNEMVFTVAGNAKEGGRLPTATGAVLAGDGDRREEVRSIGRRGGTLIVRAHLWPEHGSFRTVAGGWPMIVNDGKSVAEFAGIVEGTFPRFEGRNPRSAAGVSKDGSTLYLVAVDGRRPTDAGMTLMELAKTMLQLGAYDAMNFDGGGSTTMMVNGKIVNRPSDAAGERAIGSGLLIVSEGARKGIE
jgi:exopolysaccharide biosynthesis protein